jgi:NAD(P)-dependent dehydrogenase (short-subunit alcohol dehydrogenase family)
VPLEKIAKTTGTQVRYVPSDVTDEASVSKAFDLAASGARHPIRGLVTCAGISGRCAAVDYPVEKFRQIMDINVTGTFLCATAAAREMHRQMVSGSIVMLASMSGTNVNQVCVEL